MLNDILLNSDFLKGAFLMRKIFSVMVLAVALIFANGFNNQVSATTSSDFEAWVVYDVDYLSLMSGPSPSYNYDELARMPPGSRIVVYLGGADWSEYPQWRDDYNDNFVSVTYNGIKGFAHKRYIRMGRLLSSY